MSEILTLSSVFVIGIVASTIGSMAGGGGGLLSIAFLLFIGLPPHIAIATDRFGSIGQASTCLFKFWKAQRIAWKYVALLSVLSLAGSLIGANILLSLDPQILRYAIGVLLVVLLPVLFLKKDIGVQSKQMSSSKKSFGFVLYFLVQIVTGFFGGGTGVIILYILMIFFGMTIIEANATNTIPWFVLAASSLTIFAMNGIIDYKIGTALLAGMAIGGYIGAHVALQKGDAWVKQLFALLVIAIAIKVLFF